MERNVPPDQIVEAVGIEGFLGHGGQRRAGRSRHDGRGEGDGQRRGLGSQVERVEVEDEDEG